MMKRDLCLSEIARHRTDEIVVATYQSAFDWMRLQPHPLNYLAVGAMGLASSHALGLALGRPDKRVIVLDGDGSLLMNLGTLATVASSAVVIRHLGVIDTGHFLTVTALVTIVATVSDLGLTSIAVRVGVSMPFNPHIAPEHT